MKLDFEEVQMEKITPERAMELLRKRGVEVSKEQAALILDFMRKLANMVVGQYLDNRDGNRK